MLLAILISAALLVILVAIIVLGLLRGKTRDGFDTLPPIMPDFVNFYWYVSNPRDSPDSDLLIDGRTFRLASNTMTGQFVARSVSSDNPKIFIGRIMQQKMPMIADGPTTPLAEIQTANIPDVFTIQWDYNKKEPKAGTNFEFRMDPVVSPFRPPSLTLPRPKPDEGLIEYNGLMLITDNNPLNHYQISTRRLDKTWGMGPKMPFVSIMNATPNPIPWEFQDQSARHNHPSRATIQPRQSVSFNMEIGKTSDQITDFLKVFGIIIGTGTAALSLGTAYHVQSATRVFPEDLLVSEAELTESNLISAGIV